MKIKFWGVRGSIPSPLTPDNYKAKIRKILNIATKYELSSEGAVDDFIAQLPDNLKTTYGGNTSCVSVTSEEVSVILDAGSGLRSLGSRISEGEFINITGNEYHLFLSHLHWDHINGLPFFIPLHMDNTKINFYTAHQNCEKVLSDQQRSALFPVSLESRPIEKEFHYLNEGTNIRLKDLTIAIKRLDHPNGSFSYKLTDKYGKTIVYATDGEYRQGIDIIPFIEFYKNSDALIFDSQYSSNDIDSKIGFGHSSNEIGIDIAVQANVKRIIFFHHNHEYTDQVIEENFKRALEYHKNKYPGNFLEIITANENLEVIV